MTTHWILTYLACLVAFVAFDAAWITLVARTQYDLEAGEVLRDKPQRLAGILFYLIYTLGLAGLAVWPTTRHFNGIHATLATYRDVLAWGGGLGFFAYATFALTNQAIIKDWRYKLVIADVLWGTALSAVATLVGFGVFRLLA